MYPKAIQLTKGNGSHWYCQFNRRHNRLCVSNCLGWNVSQSNTAHNRQWVLFVNINRCDTSCGKKAWKRFVFRSARNLNAVTTVVWIRLATEVLTLLFVWNFESNYQNLFLRLPCKNFESCDNLNIQTLKHSYWFYSSRKTLPQNSAGTSTAKNTGSKTHAMAKRIRHFQLNQWRHAI